MTKEDMIRKLTSRKFWVALAGIIGGFVLIFTSDENQAQMVSGAVMECFSIVSYIWGESKADQAHVGGGSDAV